MVQLKPRSSTHPGSNPYVGPRAFEKADQLFGRDRELRELVDLLIAERVVVMHSPSGAGKTSLINAADGLLRELERQRFRPLSPVRVNERPPNEVSAVAGRYAYSIMDSLESARKSKRMVSSEQLARMTLAQYLKETQQLDPKDERSSNPLVLILDQFEEVFTLDPTDAQGRLQFFSDLGDLLEVEPVWLLFAMRDDLVGELGVVSHLVPGDLAIRYRLSLLERSAAREAITQPAKRRHDVTFSDEAADLLLDNLCTFYVQSPGSPPLPRPSPYVEGVILQTVLLNLWQELDPVQNGLRVITPDDLGDLQHVDRALGHHYYDSVQEAVRRSKLPERFVRDWFENELITKQGWRNQADHGPGDGGKKTERCLARLEEQHIIRSESRLNRRWWELVHDRFLNPVKDDNANWRMSHGLDVIPRAAKAWAEEKRPDLLLPAARMLTAATWLEAHGRDAYAIERQYIAESQKNIAKSQKAAQAERVQRQSPPTGSKKGKKWLRSSSADVLVAPGGDRPGEPVPWGASFLVNGELGRPIPLEQVTAKDFELQGTLEFNGDMGLPADRYPAISADMRERARRLVGGTSDLASVPRFLRWFENTYGRHTPAVLIHDNLICPTPNGGPLESDTASDRYFRYMLEALGVPFFKRWIMWAAVAFRTRWAVGGWRRRSVAVWIMLAALGITAFVWAVIAIATSSDGPSGLNHWAFVSLALAAPLLATPLWGKQWGASLVTAAAAPFVLPPAAIAALGYALYWLLERLARALHL